MTQRAWVFTENNPTGLIDWSINDKLGRIRYAIYQHEVGEEGTPHFQGYVEFGGPVRLSYCRKLLPGAHWEPRRGTRDEARAYCMKPESRMDGPYEYGEWLKGQGSRTDVWELKKLVDTGATLQEIWDIMPGMYLRYSRAIKEVQLLKAPKRCWKTEVHVLYGPTETGKTRLVVDTYGTAVYFKQKSQWWDGYMGQKVVILDDYYGWLPYDELLRLCDRYPMIVQTKGGQVNFAAEKLFITSNTHPTKWYKNEHILGNFDSFIRRVAFWYWVPVEHSWHRYARWEDFLHCPNANFAC